MLAVVNRVIETYGLLVNLSAEQERVAREDVTQFLAALKETDEERLAVEGVKFLRGDRPSRLRRRVILSLQSPGT
jgi:hypothetical protein